MEKYTNDLIHETSPYLLQHAHNPVNWVAWSDEVFERAKKENKLVLVSVGYSACHWCHVMEHECFEDEEVATLMNKFFINVKVDREERPDVDQVYMTAVQLMTQKGGWPLNCFTLPDGRPVYGGTYFPKEQWMHLLKSLNHTYTKEPEKVLEYAENLHKGIINSELISAPASNQEFRSERLDEMVLRWSKTFDLLNGGDSKAPKFPLPSNYDFLLDYALNSNNEQVRKHVELSLDKMALGGIYDQIGGGFSRYSVDMLWKVPHFEKMLYDNGQLVGLYAKAYKVFKKPLYKRLVYQTVEWLEREMLDSSGAFYSALDADSEGVEGKFYTWKVDELEAVLGKDFSWVREVYEVNGNGHWEHGNYILLRRMDDAAVMSKYGWSLEEFESNLTRVNQLLLDDRSSRVRPGLDDKCLTSWNALMLKGLCEAYQVFGEEAFLHLALKNVKWLEKFQLTESGVYRNYKNGKSNIDGFLDDYAHVIEAYIALYGTTFEESWLNKAKALAETAILKFGDEKSKMFFYTNSDTQLIARKMEIHDNVIPSSNSVMARNLYYLGKYFHESQFVERANIMLSNVYDGMEHYGSGYSNWGVLLNHQVFGLYEMVCMQDADVAARELLRSPLPYALIARKNEDSRLPIFSGKENEASNLIFVCVEGACLLPTSDVTEALKQVIQ